VDESVEAGSGADAPTGPLRPIDWRTLVLVGFGFAAGFGLAYRYAEPRDLAVVGAYLVALTLLLATDLDQRLLPDALTLPMIPAALAVLLFGWDPVLADKALGLPSGLAAGVVFPALLLVGSIVFHGGLGWGDVKLLVSVGLVSGVSALLVSLLAASLAFGVVLVGLLAARRVGLRSYVPFGPVIILAGAIAVLVR
jgi:leader peptidase (prepilin peptidase)/N-methyltransferase